MTAHWHDSGTKEEKVDDIIELLELENADAKTMHNGLMKMNKHQVGMLRFFILELVRPVKN